MSGLQFAAPQWIHLLWAVAAFLLLLAWLERRGRGDLGRFVTPHLQQRLVWRTTPLRRALRLVFLGLCGLFLTLALMRPQWGAQFVSTPRVGAQIMVCLDVSRSMLAEDVAPNRLERAKAELRDLLGYLEGDQVGLIAFAGRATVLSPLTPDFSFLRLVLDKAGPRSVVRGGTRLEEPIRKALAGFRSQGGEGEVSRSILLITDGEDHDSFPLEAAKAAAERGVRIISIGFGDEAGSEILVTDPETGARGLLRDADGEPVRSRLDGEMLREMALVTEGAYIPAGTGAIDLESIYERHIATLTRGRLDGGGYSVRNDAFQWALLFALVCLLAAVTVPAVAARPQDITRRSAQVLGITVAGLLAVTSVAVPKTAEAQSTPQGTEPVTEAQPKPEGREPVADAAESAPEQPSDAPADRPPPPETRSDPEDPRELYNLALTSLRGGEFDTAARRFEDVRARAGVDGEARFRATYNLGWVEVERADAVLDSDPKSALQSLQRAADWLREAIVLRPEHQASRRNLELVLRRLVALADHLAKREDQDIAKRLDKLIEGQRAFLTDLGRGVDLAALQDDPNAAEGARRALRTLAARQLELLTQAERLSESAGREQSSLQSKSDEERSTEEALRLAQLGQMSGHLHRSRERMGQARGQLRRVQAKRAYRRGADSLSDLKRARDQLLDPVARLDALLGDGMDLMRRTGQKAALEAQPDRGGPAWLTAEYLGEAQTALESRTGELHEGLSAGLTQAREAPTSPPEAGVQSESNTGPDAKQAQLLRKLETVEPLIGAAREAFREAADALAAERVGAALEPQRRGMEKLATAREHFLDLKRLVELLYRDEKRISDFIAPGEEAPDAVSDPTAPAPHAGVEAPSTSALGSAEYLPVANELQARNRERLQRVSAAILDRLGAALDAEEQAADRTQPKQAQDPSAAAAGNQDLGAERQQMEQADTLRVETEKAMLRAAEDLAAAEALTTDAPELPTSLERARESVAVALKQTEALRRLFFSVVDHLRETLRRQVDLGDRTEETSVLAETEPAEEISRRLGPLAPEQASLAETAGNIADALGQQADQPLPAPPEEQDTQGQQEQAALAEEQQARLRQAADLVTNARARMDQAAEAIGEEPPPFELIRENQEQAVEALSKALAALQPPPPEQDKEQQEQEKKEEQEAQQEPQQGKQGQQEEQPQPSPGDLGQLLQGVRDREAQRREERAKQQRHDYEPVEKDW